MPIYRFEYREGHAEEIVDGVELDDDEAARREAVRAAREIMADGILEGLDRTGWVATVYDAAGEALMALRFADLIEKRGPLA